MQHTQTFSAALILMFGAAAAGFTLPAAAAEAPYAVRPADTASSLSVHLNQARTLSFREPIGTVFVAQPGIASYQVVGNRKVIVFGSYPGRTSLMVMGTDGRTLWDGMIRVSYDIEGMMEALHSSYPKLNLTLVPLNDGVAVRGRVETPQEAANVISFLDSLLQTNPANAQMAAAASTGMEQGGEQEGESSKSGAAKGTGTLGARIGKVINQLTVTTPNQVTVRVRFAEVNRKLSDQLGFKWNNVGYHGRKYGFAFGSEENPLFTNTMDGGTLPFDPEKMLSHFSMATMFDAMASEELVSILAEPNLTVVSGETASFLAGGQIPFQSSDGEGGFDIEFKDYGVLLSVTPTILSGNRISMRIRPEVSEPSESNGIMTQGTQQPGFIVRRAESTIELASGQSFMIAGLMKNDFNNTVHKVPGLADLPIIGALARSKAFERGETELVILATAYISEPSGQPYTIPNEEFYVPNVFRRYFLDEGPQVSSRTDLKTVQPTSFFPWDRYRQVDKEGYDVRPGTAMREPAPEIVERWSQPKAEGAAEGAPFARPEARPKNARVVSDFIY